MASADSITRLTNSAADIARCHRRVRWRGDPCQHRPRSASRTTASDRCRGLGARALLRRSRRGRATSDCRGSDADRGGCRGGVGPARSLAPAPSATRTVDHRCVMARSERCDESQRDLCAPRLIGDVPHAVVMSVGDRGRHRHHELIVTSTVCSRQCWTIVSKSDVSDETSIGIENGSEPSTEISNSVPNRFVTSAIA